MRKERSGRTHGREQRLTESDVRAIRAAYRPGDPIATLARRYGASRVSIVEVVNRRTWKHLEPAPEEYHPPEDVRGTRRIEPKGRAAATVPARPGHSERKPPRPATRTEPQRRAKAAASKPQKKPFSEEEIRAIRRAYRPGVQLSRMTEKFGAKGMTILSIVNRCTYDEYETGADEYEPPAHIRGTKRREKAQTAIRERQAWPILRTTTGHLTAEAIAVIREAIDDGEPIPRVARCFGLAPEAIAHMKP